MTKKVILSAVLFFTGIILVAQTESFDIANYKPPVGWKKDVKQSVVNFTLVDNVKNTYCIIGVYSSVVSTGNEMADFKNEWNELVIKPLGASANPQTNSAAFYDGRKIVVGTSGFNNNGSENIVILISYSGFGRVMSVVTLMNNNIYQADLKSFLEGLSFNHSSSPKSAVTNTVPVANTAGPVAGSNNSSFKNVSFITPKGWTQKDYSDGIRRRHR